MYSFVPLMSIHKTSNTPVDNKESKGILRTSFLVKKKGQEQKVPVALRNEFNFLYFIRNRVCPYFAKYYCNYNIMPFSDGEVYIQYYPTSLADCRLKETQKLKII